MPCTKIQERLIVALDLPSQTHIYQMFERLFPTIRFFKLGLEAYAACGPAIVRTIKEAGGLVFLDLKYHDIPQTVHRACLAGLELGADLINLHASGGIAMMEEAARAREVWRKEAGGEERREPFPAIIGVTLLTHIGREEYLKIFGQSALDAPDFVVRLSLLARDAGLQGVVASGHEIQMIRKAVGEGFLIVTPGIRPAGEDTGGHARRVTPADALANGADLIVVGRPITGASDPLSAAQSILEEMSET